MMLRSAFVLPIVVLLQAALAASARAGVPVALHSKQGVGLADLAFRSAFDQFQRAEQVPAESAPAMYGRAAEALRAASNEHREDPRAPRALAWAGRAYERAGRVAEATEAYGDLLARYDHTRALGERGARELEGDARVERLETIAEANARLGAIYRAQGRIDEALARYNALLSDARLAVVRTHGSLVSEALAAIGEMHAGAGHWAQARAAWQAYAARATDPDNRARASVALAEVMLGSGDALGALRAFRAVRARFPLTPASLALHVRAQLGLAHAMRARGDARGYRRELTAAAALYRRGNAAPGTDAALWAAQALYEGADAEAQALMRRALRTGTERAVLAQLRALASEAAALRARLLEAVMLRGGAWAVAALARAGEIEEFVASEFAQAPQTVPEGAREALRARLSAEIEGHRTAAVQHYVLAAMVAGRERAGELHAARARERVASPENRVLLEPALRTMPPGVASAVSYDEASARAALH